MLLRETRKNDIREIKKLYRTAFPFRERKPFWFLNAQKKYGVCELFTAVDEDGRFCGFATNILYKDMVLVDYLAVLPETRGRGIGGEVLRQISVKYPDKRIFLEIESPEESAKNNPQRLKRKSFYLRNGLTETNIHIRIYGNHMELLALSGDVSFEEYRELLKETAGRLFFTFLNPRRL